MKMFLMKSESFLSMHRTDSFKAWTGKGHRCDIGGSTLILHPCWLLGCCYVVAREKGRLLGFCYAVAREPKKKGCCLGTRGGC